jgi:tRNA A-37 threonylcarbamoyl transferase component Bud32
MVDAIGVLHLSGGVAVVKFQMVKRTGHPDFLDLPWHLPLEEWRSERFVDVPRGIFRHVVRFVEYDGALYALKELPRHLAQREYRLLSRLARASIPVVEVVGVVTERTTTSGEGGVVDRAGEEHLEAVLITRHLDFSLPYRSLFTRRGMSDPVDRLLDALANLLVRLHLAGFSWGDCSLSNTLFRRDAGALAAYLVDAETGELHPQLSDGQRDVDLMIAEQNILGELLDLMAAGTLPDDIDPEETAADLRPRYSSLWDELTGDQVFDPDERFRIDERLERLNALGFDVEELELIGDPNGYELRLHPVVVEPGHHARRLHSLTGLQVQENQARRMLNDVSCYRVHLERVKGRPVPEGIAAYAWLTEVFEPTIEAIPDDLRGRLEAPELFHELLEHRWFLSEAAGRDVGLEETIASYADGILRPAPDERIVPPATAEDPDSLAEVP